MFDIGFSEILIVATLTLIIMGPKRLPETVKTITLWLGRIRNFINSAKVDIENEVGLTEGNIFMGELTFDQLLFNRPFPGYAQYRGPVKGMYMCGSGTHPGGGVMAAPGANAAREILYDLKQTNTVPEGYADD